MLGTEHPDRGPDRLDRTAALAVGDATAVTRCRSSFCLQSSYTRGARLAASALAPAPLLAATLTTSTFEAIDFTAVG